MYHVKLLQLRCRFNPVKTLNLFSLKTLLTQYYNIMHIAIFVSGITSRCISVDQANCSLKSKSSKEHFFVQG